MEKMSSRRSAAEKVREDALTRLAAADVVYVEACRAIENAAVKREKAVRAAGFNWLEIMAAMVDYDAEMTVLDRDLAAAKLNLLNMAQEVAAAHRRVFLPF